MNNVIPFPLPQKKADQAGNPGATSFDFFTNPLPSAEELEKAKRAEERETTLKKFEAVISCRKDTSRTVEAATQPMGTREVVIKGGHTDPEEIHIVGRVRENYLPDTHLGHENEPFHFPPEPSVSADTLPGAEEAPLDLNASLINWGTIGQNNKPAVNTGFQSAA